MRIVSKKPLFSRRFTLDHTNAAADQAASVLLEQGHAICKKEATRPILGIAYHPLARCILAEQLAVRSIWTQY
jgi:hypothetical protein